MLSLWKADWEQTGKGARVALYSLGTLCLLACILGTIVNLLAHDYPNAAAEILLFAYLIAWKVLWPFRIAWAVRRRGGDFGRWVFLSALLGFIIPGIIYLTIWSRKPVVTEFASAPNSA